MATWTDIDLATIPLVSDFGIELRQLEDLGQIIHFFSPTRGELAWFPAWEHAERDLRHLNPTDVPLGSIDEPFDDHDEGWRIVIFEYAGFIFIFEDDRPNGTRFPRRYRVPRDKYVFAWAALINEFNPMVSLDDLFSSGDA